MLDIPGKACGECSFCCKVLEITDLRSRPASGANIAKRPAGAESTRRGRTSAAITNAFGKAIAASVRSCGRTASA